MYRVILASNDVYEDDEVYVYEDWPYKTYEVFGGYSGSNLDAADTDDPVEAITLWFKFGRKHHSDTSISCVSRDAALRLCQAGTPELLTKLWNKYRCAYKLDYLIKECQHQVEIGCRGFYETRFGDQVHPFGVG